MTGSMKQDHANVAGIEYGGNPMNHLPEGNLTRVAGNASLAANIIGGLSISEPATSIPDIKQDPGLK